MRRFRIAQFPRISHGAEPYALQPARAIGSQSRNWRQRSRTGRLLKQITDAILAGKITVPIAATFPIDQIRDAVALQAGRHVHGKIVITL